MNAPARREMVQDLEQFRSEVRQWLEDNCPASQRQPITPEEQYYGGRNAEFPSEDAKIWFERMRDKGWICPEWPTEYGGGGLSPQEAKIIKEEMKALRARTPLYSIGIWMLGPALLEFGNEAQKQQHIRAIINGEARWAQGYSEPGSGSDLASLQCKAEDQGDHFLVNGSKIWTTAADKCDWIFCLVRTNPDAKKQEGISFLLIDMDDPGISTSPIALISGESELCQTFFDNVKVPKENLVENSTRAGALPRRYWCTNASSCQNWAVTHRGRSSHPALLPANTLRLKTAKSPMLSCAPTWWTMT